MKITASRESVDDTTAVLLGSGAIGNIQQPVEIMFRVTSAADTIYLDGNDAVTDTTGFPVSDTDGPITIQLSGDESIWAICGAAASATVAILTRGG